MWVAALLLQLLQLLLLAGFKCGKYLSLSLFFFFFFFFFSRAILTLWTPLPTQHVNLIGKDPSDLCETIANSTNLHSLAIENASLGARGVLAILNAVRGVSSLRRLAISRNIKAKSKGAASMVVSFFIFLFVVVLF